MDQSFYQFEFHSLGGRRPKFPAYRRSFADLLPGRLPKQRPFGDLSSDEYLARNKSGVAAVVPALPPLGIPNRQAGQMLHAGERSRGATLSQPEPTALRCVTKKAERHRHPQSSPATPLPTAGRFAF